MQHAPKLRALPLLLAAAFYTTHSHAEDNAAAADAAATDKPLQQVEVIAAHMKSARIDLSPNVAPPCIRSTAT